MNRSITRMEASRGPNRPGSTGNPRRPRGFTLVELLVVIVVLGILMALLLPVISGAIRTAREAAVSAEINQIAIALENFKAKYGDYPPSRIMLIENGDYSTVIGGGNIPLTSAGVGYFTGKVDPTSPGVGDITVSQLAQRSVAALRRFFPKLVLSTSGGVPQGISQNFWYDFNGDFTGSGKDGNSVQAYVLHGHECLVFFLGGVPVYDSSSGTYGLTGFSNLPTNPFTNANMTVTGSARQQPFFEFNPGRLFPDPNNPFAIAQRPASAIPGYYDTLNSGPPVGAGQANFYVYFSAYGNGNYDPNDVNFGGPDPNNPPPLTEQDVNSHFPVGLVFTNSVSYIPNPYTASQTVATSSGAVTFQKPQTFQVISSGIDGFYGVGGQYLLNPTSQGAEVLPLDARTVNGVPVTFNGSSPSSGNPEANPATGDPAIRVRERDNVTNFKGGRLQ